MSFASLKSQDPIALVCTGTPCSTEEDPRLAAQYLLAQYGFQTRYHFDTYKSLSAEERALIFFRYLADDAIKALWSVRGGEGTADIIPYLEARSHEIKHFKPKLLIGFSDFTPLLVYFSERFGWPVMHGLGARQLPLGMVNTRSIDTTLNWLCDTTSQIDIPLLPLNPLAYIERNFSAPVIGGNLTLLQISIGDIWQLHAAHKILLLEEVNEPPYKVTRTLKYLQRIGFFSEVKAILLAGFDFPNLDAEQNRENHRAMQAVFSRFALECHCPVFYTGEIGHGSTNYPVPFTNATLTLGTKPLLKFKRFVIGG